MIYGYIRVSTDKQSVESQRLEIKNFAKKANFNINGWLEETISGRKDYIERQLGNLLDKLQKSDILICSDLSRLGRDLLMIMEILRLLMKKGIKLWTVKENYRLGDDISSKVLAFAFGISAEIERSLISQRTKAGLINARAKGKVGGRKKGLDEKAQKKAKIAVALYNEYQTNNKGNRTVNDLSEIAGVSKSTFYRYLRYEGITFDNEI
jgi:DNA invertase Pin-like site-specific DNA recombinase